VPLYEATHTGLQRRPEADFAALEMYERQDLQRLLRDEIGALGEDLLVISEEFGNWEDARRRIDLLAIDKSGRMVVIEIKRTHEGGHMELQAIRYAAMVSSMGFDEVVEAYTAHCAKVRPQQEVDARAELEEFLEGGDDNEPVISTDVRIILVSANFGREITTAVLWLNRFDGMDIRCVRLIPYEFDGKILLDVQQVIPLPEAADYQVRLRKKDAAQERARRVERDLTRFHIIVDGNELPDENKRNSIRVMVEQLAKRGAPLDEINSLISKRMKRVRGVYRDSDALEAALRSVEPDIDLRRWFTDYPFVDEANSETFVLSNQWGRRTEAKLTALSEAFPDAKVTFRVANRADD
jgi:hypothetical protein